MCSLSGELQESYNAALLNGTSLKMPIKSWEVLTNYLSADSGGSFDVAISKSKTRLAKLFAVFNQNPPGDNLGKVKVVNTNYVLSNSQVRGGSVSPGDGVTKGAGQ